MIATTSDLLAIKELFSQITISRQLTGVDFNLLSLALVSNSLDEEEKSAVKRIFYAVRRGWLKLVDISEEQDRTIQSCLEMVLCDRV